MEPEVEREVRHRGARRWAGERLGLLLRAAGTRRHRDDPTTVMGAALRIMRASRYCVLVTVGDAGPHARVVQPFHPDHDLAVRVGTSPTSRKATEMRATGKALLVYTRERDGACVVADCDAVEVDDPDRHRWFMPQWRAFWPAGPDADFTAFRCLPHRLEVWSARDGVTPPPFGLRSAVLTRDGDAWR